MKYRLNDLSENEAAGHGDSQVKGKQLSGLQAVIYASDVNMKKVLTTTVQDVHDAIREATQGFIKANPELFVDAKHMLEAGSLTSHVYGNVTLNLIAKQGIREREHKLPAVCDSCTEWYKGDGVDLDTDVTPAELMQIAHETGYLVGDHTCDDPSTCVCSCDN